MKSIAFFILALGLLACSKTPESDALKYADAPIGQVPSGAVSTPGPGTAGSPEDFSEFKKKEGCTTEDEIKKKNAELAAKGQAASLQGAKDPDCAVK